jgi:hypothetical protein
MSKIGTVEDKIRSKLDSLEESVREKGIAFKSLVRRNADDLKKEPSNAMVLIGTGVLGAGMVVTMSGLMEQVVSYGVSAYGQQVARKFVEVGSYSMGGGFVVLLSGLSAKAANYVYEHVKRG